jgi:sulfur transfer protein SufE
MRPDEEFVAKALVSFFGGPSVVSAFDGEDPPDFYLSFCAARVGVEVTRLSQFTFEPDGSLGNRSTQDSFGLRLIEDLNTKLANSVPHDLSLLIGLWVPVQKPALFRKRLFSWITQVAANPEMGLHQEQQIAGAKASVWIIPARPSGKKVVGFVFNENSSVDIGLNALLILQDRIRTKSEICQKSPKPIWLAMLNDYWIADADSYELAARRLKLEHCFQRIFIVSDVGAVREIVVEA